MPVRFNPVGMVIKRGKYLIDSVAAALEKPDDPPALRLFGGVRIEIGKSAEQQFGDLLLRHDLLAGFLRRLFRNLLRNAFFFQFLQQSAADCPRVFYQVPGQSGGQLAVIQITELEAAFQRRLNLVLGIVFLSQPVAKIGKAPVAAGQNP
jgi:hypothetical protein